MNVLSVLSLEDLGYLHRGRSRPRALVLTDERSQTVEEIFTADDLADRVDELRSILVATDAGFLLKPRERTDDTKLSRALLKLAKVIETKRLDAMYISGEHTAITDAGKPVNRAVQ